MTEQNSNVADLLKKAKKLQGGQLGEEENSKKVNSSIWQLEIWVHFSFKVLLIFHISSYFSLLGVWMEMLIILNDSILL